VVDVASPEDALLQGFEPFVVEDELYIIEAAADIEVLLTARWGGTAPNGMRIPERDQPLMYRRRIGAGEVVYVALGHTNPEGVSVRGEKVGERRGAWDSPVFREVLRRAITRAL
jgi:type 1 glutamine amidotransferase